MTSIFLNMFNKKEQKKSPDENKDYKPPELFDGLQVKNPVKNIQENSTQNTENSSGEPIKKQNSLSKHKNSLESNEDELQDDAVVIKIPTLEEKQKMEEAKIIDGMVVGGENPKIMDLNKLPEFQEAKEKAQKENLYNPISLKEKLQELIKSDPMKAQETLINSELNSLNSKIIELQIKQKDFLLGKIAAKKEFEKFQKQSELLAGELSESIRVEKYSEAESLQHKFNMIEEGIRKAKDQLEKVEEIINSYEQRKILLEKRKFEILEIAIPLLKEWSQNEEILIREFEAGTNMKIEDEFQKAENLKNECKEIEKKVENAENIKSVKTKEFEETLNTVCEKWIKDRNILDSEIKGIDEEIFELQKKLDEKLLIKNEKSKKREEIQNEINTVKENYKNEQLELEKLGENIENLKLNLQKNNFQITTHVQSAENFEKAKKETAEKRKNVLGQIRNEIIHNSENSSKSKELVKTKEFIRDQKNENYTEIAKMQIKKKNLEGKGDFYKDKLAKIETQIKEFNQNLINLKNSLSKFEEDKKIFATQRKFKVFLLIFPNILIGSFKSIK